jgi:hypothetical protein
MAQFTRALFLQALDQWGSYPEACAGLPETEQTLFLQEQGYASCRELLAHVAVWWEESRARIGDVLARRPAPPQHYSFDSFNAVAVNRFKDTPDAEFAAWYESQRHEMFAMIQAMTEDQLKSSRVAGWLDGVVLEHLKEHCVGAPRFLAMDILQREWAEYPGRFGALPPEKQSAFLKKQGFARFRDLAAHIIAWWEQGIQSIEASAQGDVAEVDDIDGFNAEAVERFGKLEADAVFVRYEETRLTLVRLIDTLPGQVYSKPNVQGWLRADVLAHYYDHAL